MTLEPDGTTRLNPSGAPTSFLPDGSGLQIVMRFIQSAEGIPTYAGLVSHFATYSAVLAAYPSYADIQTDANLAIDYDIDIACMVTGCSVRNGRNGLFADLQAASCEVSVYDPHGLFDPRSIDTILGPGRRVRAGTWVRVSVMPHGTSAWVAMFTGLVDTWDRNITPEDATDVRVACSDFFEGIAAAAYTGTTVVQLTGARVNALLALAWQSAWGITSVAAGTVNLDARTIDHEVTLDLIKAAAAVEDGRAFIAPDGTFMFQDGTWGGNRHPVVTFLGAGADVFETTLHDCNYGYIAAFVPSYAEVLNDYLVYADLATCAPTGAGGATVPTVCTSKMVASDSGDDVVNDVTLEYTAPAPPVGFVAKTNTKVNASAPTLFNAQDLASQARYGIRSMRRGDLTPNTPSAVLPTLANTLVQRWKDGDATVTSVDVDLGAVGGNAAAIVTAMFAGVLVNMVDLVPGASGQAGEWMVSTAEVSAMAWNMNPDRFTVSLDLDEISQVAQ